MAALDQGVPGHTTSLYSLRSSSSYMKSFKLVKFESSSKLKTKASNI